MSVERAVTRHDVYNLVLEHEAAFHAVVGADTPGEVKIVVITHGGADLKKVKRELRSTFFKKGVAGLRYRFKMIEGPSGGYREPSPVRTPSADDTEEIVRDIVLKHEDVLEVTVTSQKRAPLAAEPSRVVTPGVIGIEIRVRHGACYEVVVGELQRRLDLAPVDAVHFKITIIGGPY